MDDNTAVIESDDDLLKQTGEGSSDDLREALQSSFREVAERQRDEQGRFARETQQQAQAQAQKAAAPAPQPQQAQEPVDQQGNQSAPAPAPSPAQQTQPGAQQQAPEAQQQNQAPRAPDSWSPAAKAQFASLPPDVQQEIARREREVHQGFTRQDEQRNLGKNFEQTVQPYLAMIRAEGSDPVRAAGALMQTAYTLRVGTPEQKEQMLIGLMNQYQIDPNRVFQRLTGGQQAQQQVDPQVAALSQQVQQLQQFIQSGQQATQVQEQRSIDQTIESFASDPKNLYFANVRAEMAALLGNGRAKDLQEAYDMAIWAHPQIRPLLLQQQEQQRQAETRNRTARARAAGSALTGSPTGSASGVSAPAANGSIEDDIRNVYREVMSRDA